MGGLFFPIGFLLHKWAETGQKGMGVLSSYASVGIGGKRRGMVRFDIWRVKCQKK